MENQRVIGLKEFMKRYDITYRAIAEHLGITAGAVPYILQSKFIQTERYNKLLSLGFPQEILPIPKDNPRKKDARFPGLNCD